MERTLKRARGNWVEGDRFWGRETELALLTEYLDDNAHILMVAQRRIGKTSLMRETARRIQDRYLCLHVDLQSAESAADAIVELSAATHPHRSLWKKTQGIFTNVLGQLSERIDTLQLDAIKVTLRGGLAGGDWQAKGDQLFKILSEAEKPAVIFFDEVPILVNRMLKGSDYRITPERRQQVDAFMSWLRENSIRHQGTVGIVVTGSIGLEPVLQQAGLSATLNTLAPFELAPWSRETATGCLEALARQYNLNYQEGTVDTVLDCLGICIPYHVQMFFDHLYQTCRLRQLNKVTETLVTEVYESNMLSTRGHAELHHNEERLKLVLGPDLYPLALDLLTEAAVSSDGLSKESADFLVREHFPNDPRPTDRLREILNVLEHDGLLQRNQNTYVFVSKLLKDWWKARFVFHYVCVADRRVA